MIQDALLNLVIDLTERGLVPDALIRRGIRSLCAQRLDEQQDPATTEQFIDSMRTGPIAPVPEKANEQHYEVPAAFYEHVLGRHRKYSCCLWDGPNDTLDAAEARALEVSCQRARLDDGQDILELGCGWGSLTLHMAATYPGSQITAVSNSSSQRAHIERMAFDRGLRNLRVITADMNDFSIDETFDRVVSIEMFEHMRNYQELLRRVASWLRPDGRLFVHVFCHRASAYPFEVEGPGNWMGRHFFSGGLMPSADLFNRFTADMTPIEQWTWDGTHYQRTAEAWLENIDRRIEAVRPVLRETYGTADAERWRRRWRVFFMACAELFGYRQGQEWQVAHTLFEPNATIGESRTIRGANTRAPRGKAPLDP